MEAVIFDIDGTLWDAKDEIVYSWNIAIKEHGGVDKVLTSDMIIPELGKPMNEIMKDLFPELTGEERDSLAEDLYRVENKWVESAPCIVYDGVLETIRELSRQYTLMIVSNCQSGYIEAFLKNTGLGEFFSDYACPGDTGMLKGENIRLVMNRNGIHEAVYVGDTQGDADACKIAGVPMIFAEYGFGKVEGEYPRISRFPDLLDMLL